MGITYSALDLRNVPTTSNKDLPKDRVHGVCAVEALVEDNLPS